MSRLPVPTSVRFPRETKVALEKEALQRRWSVSVLINEIVKQWLAFTKKQKT